MVMVPKAQVTSLMSAVDSLHAALMELLHAVKALVKELEDEH